MWQVGDRVRLLHARTAGHTVRLEPRGVGGTVRRLDASAHDDPVARVQWDGDPDARDPGSYRGYRSGRLVREDGA